MKHMNREEALIEGLLRKTRTIAVIGASPRPGRHSGEVVAYLHDVGYDVIPVRPDRMAVAELPTFARLSDVAGPIDLVVIFRRADAIPAHISEAAARRPMAVWLPPGTWSRAASEEAEKHVVLVVKERCILEEHRHLFGAIGEPTAGHLRRLAVPRRARRTSA
jgi:predicted CoA-binding protein